MAERFTRLYWLGDDLYLDGSPMVISAGVLLSDTVTGSIIAQLKFQNVSAKEITAAKVKLAAYDVTGKALHEVEEYQYLDLNVSTGAYWGGDKAIILPEQITRSFSIKSAEIVFRDGTTWRSDNIERFTTIPLSPTLETELTDKALADQYRLETNQSAKYTPKNHGKLWRCACGCINQGMICTECHIGKEKAFDTFDISALSERSAARLEGEARQAKENQVQQQRRRKTATIAFLVGLVLVVGLAFFALWVMPKVIQPAQKYNEAVELFQNGEYHQAEILFAELDGYKDSQDYLEKIPYSTAESIYDSGDYEAAYATFVELGEYQDSKDRALQSAYQYAQELEANGEYISAREWFRLAIPYDDSTECVDRLHGLIFERGSELFADGNYTEALVYLQEVPSTFQTDNNSVTTLIEQAKTAEEYLLTLDILEHAEETVVSSETFDAVIEAIKRYGEIHEIGYQITGENLSAQKKAMVEMYNLYAGYVGRYMSEHSFLGNLTVELMFSQGRSGTGYIYLKISGTENYLHTEYIAGGSLESEKYRLIDEENIQYVGYDSDFLYSRNKY